MISTREDGEHYRAHVDALRAGEREGLMRIMRANMPDDCPRYIRMDALNQEWAQKNHDQTLKRLNERGGLSACEAAAIMQRRQWYRMAVEDAIAAIKDYAVSET